MLHLFLTMVVDHPKEEGYKLNLKSIGEIDINMLSISQY